MKRLTGLWPQVTDFNNLYCAYIKARKAKQHRVVVARFSFDLEQQIVNLQRELVNGQYQPGAYRQFWINDRKPRLISAAPFRDRVVQHAVMAPLEPLMDKRLIAHTYACRKGKGVHRAINYYQKKAHRYAYVLKLDIARYFPSIDHQVLRSQLRGLLKEPELLHWFDITIASGGQRGLPIGNLVSQYLSNWYLNGIDHWLDEQRGVAYLRYVDDMVLLADEKHRLWDIKCQLEHRLQLLNLSLHSRKQQLSRTTEKIDLLGYQVARYKRWLRNDNGYRACRRINKMLADVDQGKKTFNELRPNIQSWVGHALHGETEGLRACMKGMLVK